MKKVIAVLLVILAVVAFSTVCSKIEEDTLAAEFVEYVRTEAAKQGVSAEYLLEHGDISFEEWKETHPGHPG